MARSHHRKKHKAHVRQFKQSHDTSVSSPTRKGKATPIFSVGGAVAGFAIGYFASGGSIVWMTILTIAGAGGGYFFGKKFDKEDKK